MKYIREENIMDFTFWSGGAVTARRLEESGHLEEIEELINELWEERGEYPTETEINDFLWFETDFIAEYLGYKDWEEFCLREQEDEEEDEDIESPF